VTTAIRFEAVSKKFSLHRQDTRSFQEALLNLIPVHRPSPDSKEFWVLRDVSFQIAAGETVGLIGPNGVGKSTVLKLIARILDVTSGRIEVNGRVGPLLELGAGFHPDLTGRENIYLNASVLGLSRFEISQRLDAIIDFSELERFIDVPVKYYSSGMYLRLGFAVAVHTDPEILLIDELLAVGDATFQRKCLERIDQMRQDGVTLLFVSHDSAAIRKLCARAIWLESGELMADGPTDTVVQRYLNHSWSAEEGKVRVTDDAQCWGSGRVRIIGVQLLDEDGSEKQVFEMGESLTIASHYRAIGRVDNPIFGLAIHRSDGTHITGPNTRFENVGIPYIEGEGEVSYRIDDLPLLEGVYAVSVAVTNNTETEIYDYHDRLYPFRVRALEEDEQYGLIALGGHWLWSRD
jgi:lipopolysaccharide transport system ATP-binding protein